MEQYAKRSPKAWLYKEYEGEDAVLVLDSIEFQLGFRDMYARVNFELLED